MQPVESYFNWTRWHIFKEFESLDNWEMTLRRIFARNKSLIYAILIPLVSSILPICVRQKPAYCGFVLFVMSGFWITECLPIAITSLLPVVLFPIFGILDSKSTSKIYFEVTKLKATKPFSWWKSQSSYFSFNLKDINMLFLGSKWLKNCTNY